MVEDIQVVSTGSLGAWTWPWAWAACRAAGVG